MTSIIKLKSASMWSIVQVLVWCWTLLQSVVNAQFAPSLLSVTTTAANGTYIAGATIDFRLTFNSTASLSPCSAGSATLMLNVQSAPSSAVYLSGSGTNQWIFRYTVQESDSTPTGAILDVLPAGSSTFITSDLKGAYGTSPLVFPINSGCGVVDSGTMTAMSNAAQLTLTFARTLSGSYSKIYVVNPRLSMTLNSTFTETTFKSGYMLTLIYNISHQWLASLNTAYNLTLSVPSLFEGQNANWSLWIDPSSMVTFPTATAANGIKTYPFASASNPTLAFWPSVFFNSSNMFQYFAQLRFDAYLNGTVPALSLFMQNASLSWASVEFNTSPVFPVNVAVRTISVTNTLPLGVATNLAPYFDGPTSYIMVQQNPLLINDQSLMDPDFYYYNADGLITVGISCTSGTISLAPGTFNALLFTNGSATNVTSMTFTAPLHVAQAAVRGLIYYSVSVFEMSVTLTANDNANSGMGGIKTVSKTVTITAAPVIQNSLQITAPYKVTIPEDGTFTLASVSLYDPLFRADMNFSFTLSVTSGVINRTQTIAFIAQNNTINIPLDGYERVQTFMAVQFVGTYTQLNQQMSSIVYIPNLHVNQLSEIPVMSIQVNDFIRPEVVSNFSFPIYITPVNQGPIFSFPAANFTVNESTPLYIRGITFFDYDYEESHNALLYVEIECYQGKLNLNSTAGLTFLSVKGLADGTDGFFSGVYTASTQARYFAFLADLKSLGWAVSAGLTYVPNVFYNGDDVLRISISDQGFVGAGGVLWANNSVPIFIISWNTPPFIAGPSLLVQPLQAVEDTVYDIKFNFTDVDSFNGQFTVQLLPVLGRISLQQSALPNVQLLTGNGMNDTAMVFTCSYTDCQNAVSHIYFLPYFNYNGADAAMHVVISDDGSDASGMGGIMNSTWDVYLTVAAVNDPPTINVPPTSLKVRSWESLYLGQSIFISDLDVSESAEGMLHVILRVSNGTLTLRSSFDSIHFGPSSTGSNDTTLEFWSDLGSITRALTTLVYFPSSTFTGYTYTDLVQVYVDDMGWVGSGGVLNATAFVVINIQLIDRPLVISMPSFYQGMEDQTFSIPNLLVFTLDPLPMSTQLINVTLRTRWGSLAVPTVPGVQVWSWAEANRSLLLRGTLANVQTALNGLTFRARINCNDLSCGPDTIIVSTAFTAVGFGVGYSQLGDVDDINITSTATRVVSVLPVNDIPEHHWLVAPTTMENQELRLTNLWLDDVDIIEDFQGRMQITASVAYGRLRMYAIDGCVLIEGTPPWTYTQQTQKPWCLARNGTWPWQWNLCQNDTFGDTRIVVDCNREVLRSFVAHLAYIPPLGFIGNDTITTIAHDIGYTGAGGNLSVTIVQPLPVYPLPTREPFLHFPVPALDGITPGVTSANLTQVPGLESALVVVEDTPTLILMQLISWEGYTSNFTLNVDIGTGTLKLMNSSVPVGLGNATMTATPLSQLPAATGLGQALDAAPVTFTLLNVTAYSTVMLHWLFTPTPHWNSVRRGYEYIRASAYNTAGGPLNATASFADLKLIVLAQNDAPVVNVAPISSPTRNIPLTGVTAATTPTNSINVSVFENNILLLDISVIDVDLWEGMPDGLLYFEIVLAGGRGNLTLNSTDGISYLSDQIMPFIPQNEWRRLNADPSHFTLQLTTPPPYLNPTRTPNWLVTVGSPNLAGYGTPEAITQALSGLRYTPTTNYFGPEQLKIAISDRGISHPCMSASASVMPTAPGLNSFNGGLGLGGSVDASSFASAIKPSWDLTAAFLGSSVYKFNQHFNGTTASCSGPWLWANATININVMGVNHAGIINFSSLQVPPANQATLNQPPTYWVYEDTWLSIPQLVLVDREQTLPVCANNRYNITVQATFGYVGLNPPSGSAAATLLSNTANLVYYVGSGFNDTVLMIGGTLPTLNVAMTYLRFLPAADYHGLEAKIIITLTDDGCPAAMGPGQASVSIATPLTIYFDVISVNDQPVLYLPTSLPFVNGNLWAITPESTTYTFSEAFGNAFRIFDVDFKNDQGSLFHVTLSVSNGTLSFIDDWGALFNNEFTVPGLHFVRGNGRENTVMEFYVEYDILNQRLASGLLYTPNQYFNGPDLLFFQIDDQHASGMGATRDRWSVDKVLNTSGVIKIQVTPVDTPLDLTVPILFTGFEDIPLQLKPITLSSIDSYTAPTGLAVNVTAVFTVLTGWLDVRNATWQSTLNITQVKPYASINPLNYGQNVTMVLSVSGTLAQMIAFLRDCSVTYVAPVHQNGYDDFWVEVSYPTQTNNMSRPIISTTPPTNSLIRLNAVNDAPVLTVNQTLRFVQQDGDDLLMQDQPISVFDLDLDEQASLQYGMLLLNLTCSHGTLSLAQLDGLRVMGDGVHPAKSFVVEGGIADLNASLTTLRYKPDPHYFGLDTILIWLGDQGFTGASPNEPSDLYTTGTELGPKTPLFTTSHIPINVTYFNWPPVAGLRYDETTDEDVPLKLSPFNFTHINHPSPIATTYQVDISVLRGWLNATLVPPTVTLVRNGSNVPYRCYDQMSLPCNWESSLVEIVLTFRSSDMPALHQAMANIVYLPWFNFHGNDLMRFNVTDLNDLNSWCSNRTYINVRSVNDVPELSFINSSYPAVAYMVPQAVPVRLPMVNLTDVDAPESPYIMTLIVESKYGSVSLVAPYDLAHGFNLATGAPIGAPGDYTPFGNIGDYIGGKNTTQRIVMQGSLAQLKEWVNAIEFTSSTSIDPITGVNTMFPAFFNDTVNITVIDGGASGTPVAFVQPTPLRVSLILPISVRPAPNPPKIVTPLPSPLNLFEDTVFAFTPSTLSLAYVDGAVGATLRSTLFVSAQAASWGTRLQTDPAQCTLTMTLAEINTTFPITTTSNMTVTSTAPTVGSSIRHASPEASPFVLNGTSPTLVYTMIGSLAPMSACLSYLKIVPPLHRFGHLDEALIIQVDDMGLLDPWGGTVGAYGTLTYTQAWDFQIAPVNDRPTIALASSTMTVAAVNSLAIQSSRVLPTITLADVDVDLMENFYGPLMVTLTVTNGTMDMMSPPAGVTLMAGQLSHSTMFTVMGMPSALNQALAGVYYQAPMYMCTTDAVYIEVNDQGFFGMGGALSSNATISVKVTC